MLCFISILGFAGVYLSQYAIGQKMLTLYALLMALIFLLVLIAGGVLVGATQHLVRAHHFAASLLRVGVTGVWHAPPPRAFPSLNRADSLLVSCLVCMANGQNDDTASVNDFMGRYGRVSDCYSLPRLGRTAVVCVPVVAVCLSREVADPGSSLCCALVSTWTCPTSNHPCVFAVSLHCRRAVLPLQGVQHVLQPDGAASHAPAGLLGPQPQLQ